MTDETPVLTAFTDGVLEVTLNRPDKLNAFNDAMHHAMSAALQRAETDDACRAVLLTGAGRGFCAGQDLSDRMGAAGGPPDLGRTLDTLYNPMMRRLKALPKPVVAAVNGVAAGAGANIALACDIVLAAESARFIQAFVKIGLVPDSGGTWFLPRLVGMQRAKAMAMLGDAVSAEEAERIGLIWRCIDDEKLMPEAEALAKRLAQAPTRALALIKSGLNASFDNTLEKQLELEKHLQQVAGRTRDYSEGVAAFLEKRKPEFTGE